MPTLVNANMRQLGAPVVAEPALVGALTRVDVLMGEDLKEEGGGVERGGGRFGVEDRSLRPRQAQDKEADGQCKLEFKLE